MSPTPFATPLNQGNTATMPESFFDKPILNSPYEYPAKHWELDPTGQPTNVVLNKRRPVDFATPIPKTKKQKKSMQAEIAFQDAMGISTEEQQYDLRVIINALRPMVNNWRALPNPADWKVTPDTARLLQYWRHHEFGSIRPFFCQIEAVETIIWLTEVAPKLGKSAHMFLNHLHNANDDANPGLSRIALKLATGAGKTTVMAMIIAWQTVNAVRRPNSKRFTRGFLIVAPGITIRDRLRVLKPNDPDSYFSTRELVPADMMPDIDRAKIVITNFHAFQLRETMTLSKGGRMLLQGRDDPLNTMETEGQMLQRVVPELMGLKNIMVLNDEAHHCYREKPADPDEISLKGDERKEAEENSKAARVWISGLEAIARTLGVSRIVDLSATPFFLSGSGYAEGSLFTWTMSDFSLMDAIECGIVKLPRVPIADNIPGAEMPIFRELWKHIGKDMPKKGRKKGEPPYPLSIPTRLNTALEALYGHYKLTYELWEREKISVPPCFIVVCNNTTSSKLVYDYISGFMRTSEDGTEVFRQGALELFCNYDQHGNSLGRPNTLLIDSQQLESGDALDVTFRKHADDEIKRFRREIIERGDVRKADNISDQDLLREIMNTVGKKGQLGEQIRCVVSVSMLTEGWDANNVTHILGVRAFGTQLLCEQVIGRALRRQSYDLNEDNKFNVEYADVLGIPFDFNAKPVVSKVQPPRETIQVKPVRPDRDDLEIRFPRVAGYRIELPEEQLKEVTFTDDSTLVLTPDLVGPTQTQNAGIIGEQVNLSLVHTRTLRQSALLMNLTMRLIESQPQFRDDYEQFKYHLYGKLKKVVRHWLEHHLDCKGDTYPAQLMFQELADRACERIGAAITLAYADTETVKAVLDPYNPEGSTAQVNFNTSKTDRWETDHRRCHINWVILDSDWEAEFCRVAEQHPRVRSYVKNHNLGFEVPYRMGGESHVYRPDFIVLVDDGRGDDDLLNLVVEIKGFRGEDAKDKKNTMDAYWIPGVNNIKRYGRWAFVEFCDVYEIQVDFANEVAGKFDAMIDGVCATQKAGDA
jgi:type III restriction enzyme